MIKHQLLFSRDFNEPGVPLGDMSGDGAISGRAGKLKRSKEAVGQRSTINGQLDGGMHLISDDDRGCIELQDPTVAGEGSDSKKQGQLGMPALSSKWHPRGGGSGRGTGHKILRTSHMAYVSSQPLLGRQSSYGGKKDNLSGGGGNGGGNEIGMGGGRREGARGEGGGQQLEPPHWMTGGELCSGDAMNAEAPSDNRIKNRDAQRRFRDRQKSDISQLRDKLLVLQNKVRGKEVKDILKRSFYEELGSRVFPPQP